MKQKSLHASINFILPLYMYNLEIIYIHILKFIQFHFYKHHNFYVKLKGCCFYHTVSHTHLLSNSFLDISAQAIQCYQCDSNEDLSCPSYESFDKEVNAPINCNSFEANTPGQFCMKITQESPGCKQLKFSLKVKRYKIIVAGELQCSIWGEIHSFGGQYTVLLYVFTFKNILKLPATELTLSYAHIMHFILVNFEECPCQECKELRTIYNIVLPPTFW